MVKISPFKPIHATPETAPIISAEPYDVVSRQYSREVINNNHKSFLKISRPDAEFDDSISPYESCIYEKAKENLNLFLKDNLLVKDEEEMFFIYSQIAPTHTQNGLVCCCAVEDYVNNKIKKHEKTREVKEKDRTTHMDVLNTHLEPVFLTYPSREDIDDIVDSYIQNATPYIDFSSDDGIHHKLWKITEKNIIIKLVNIFSMIRDLYIADGHHRAASSAKVGLLRQEKNNTHNGSEDYNHFLAVLFPSEQLQILAYNRVVKDLGGLTALQLIEKIKENFIVDEINPERDKLPEKRSQFSMFLDKKWFSLQAKENIIEKDHVVNSLDASILQNYIFDKILNIKNPRTDNRLDFVGGISGTKELEKKVNEGEAIVAFALYPTSINSLMEVADKDLLMPPKSTWFEPKLRSGLFLHSL